MRFRDILTVETAAAICGAAIVTFLVDVTHISPYWLLLLLPLFGLFVGYTVARERLAVFRSGLIAYLDSFPFATGPSYWQEAAEELAYWGVTGASIAEHLKAAISNEPGASRRYRFLLMSPHGSAIREQIAFKKHFSLTSTSVEEEEQINAEIKVEAQRLRATIAVLKSTQAFRSSPSRLEIRLYDEFLPCWMYLIDTDRTVVGILRRGQEGGEQPAAILTRNPLKVTLFETFQENFERVWRSAERI